MKRFLFVLILFTPALSLAIESAEFAEKVVHEHGLSGVAAQQMRRILMSTPATRNIGTEDPDAVFGTHRAVHPASRKSCIDRVLKTGLIKSNPKFEKICGARWMAPVPVLGQPLENSRVCIDQFEFPNIPCEYPLVWSTAPLAKQICETMGKRACNSHEWEGGCAGGMDAKKDPYLFGLPSLEARRATYNNRREKVWAFSSVRELVGRPSRELCGIYSASDADIDPRVRARLKEFYTPIGKSPSCQTTNSDYLNCGSHTWPSGFKYLCGSENQVYDMHGNVAEVVSFPSSAAEIAIGQRTGHTERKGSFFVPRDNYPDDCRVRQPYEHFGVFTTDHMAYYQEGFRCCKDL